MFYQLPFISAIFTPVMIFICALTNRSCPLLRFVTDVCCSSPMQTTMSGSILHCPADDIYITYSGQAQVSLAWDWRHVTTSYHTTRLLHLWFDDTINAVPSVGPGILWLNDAKHWFDGSLLR